MGINVKNNNAWKKRVLEKKSTEQGETMNHKILIIDDDSANRRLFRDLFEMKGFKIVEASSGEDGIDKAEKECPDLILMDIRMPGMDGYQTAQIIKKRSTTIYQ